MRAAANHVTGLTARPLLPSMRISPGPRTTDRLMLCPGGKTIGRTVSANGFMGTRTRIAQRRLEDGPPLA